MVSGIINCFGLPGRHPDQLREFIHETHAQAQLATAKGDLVCARRRRRRAAAAEYVLALTLKERHVPAEVDDHKLAQAVNADALTPAEVRREVEHLEEQERRNDAVQARLERRAEAARLRLARLELSIPRRRTPAPQTRATQRPRPRAPTRNTPTTSVEATAGRDAPEPAPEEPEPDPAPGLHAIAYKLLVAIFRLRPDRRLHAVGLISTTCTAELVASWLDRLGAFDAVETPRCSCCLRPMPHMPSAYDPEHGSHRVPVVWCEACACNAADKPAKDGRAR